jgi:hypothetical protein
VILSDMVHRPKALECKHIETINVSDPIPAMDVGLAWPRNIEFTRPVGDFRIYCQQTCQIPKSRQKVDLLMNWERSIRK